MRIHNKFLATLIALCFIVSLIPIVSAATPYSGTPVVGDVFTREEDSIYLENKLNGTSNLAEPGSEVYVVLETYNPYAKVKSMKIVAEDSSSKNVVTNQSLTETMILKDSSGNRYICAVVPINSISITKFKKASYLDYDGKIVGKFKTNDKLFANYPTFNGNVYDLGGTSEEIDISFSVGYGDMPANYELNDTACRYDFSKNDDVVLDFNNMEISFETTAETTAILSANDDALDEIEELYGNFAELTYFNLKGSLSKVKNFEVVIDADEAGKYLYKYQNGSLYDMSYCYTGEDDDTFEFKVTGSSIELCTYMISNFALDLSRSPILPGSETVIAEEPDDPDTTRPDAVVPDSTIKVVSIDSYLSGMEEATTVSPISSVKPQAATLPNTGCAE